MLYRMLVAVVAVLMIIGSEGGASNPCDSVEFSLQLKSFTNIYTDPSNYKFVNRYRGGVRRCDFMGKCDILFSICVSKKGQRDCGIIKASSTKRIDYGAGHALTYNFGTTIGDLTNPLIVNASKTILNGVNVKITVADRDDWLIIPRFEEIVDTYSFDTSVKTGQSRAICLKGTQHNNPKIISKLCLRTSVSHVNEICSCPQDITLNPFTVNGSVDYVLPISNQKVRLPVGQHNFTVSLKTVNCTYTATVNDTDVRRQLQFQAQYDVSCMLISSDVARNLLKSTAGSNYQHIKEICGQDCHGAPIDTTSIECQNNTLTVTWPVQLSAVTIADSMRIQKLLTTKLKGRSSILQMVVTTRDPPVVFPRKQSDGTLARVRISSECVFGTYSVKEDRCII